MRARYVRNISEPRVPLPRNVDPVTALVRDVGVNLASLQQLGATYVVERVQDEYDLVVDQRGVTGCCDC